MIDKIIKNFKKHIKETDNKLVLLLLSIYFIFIITFYYFIYGVVYIIKGISYLFNLFTKNKGNKNGTKDRQNARKKV